MSQEDIAIKVDNVSKSFKLPHERHGSIKSIFLSGFQRKRTYEKQQALKDISFEVKKGEFFGIVGRNGSGKSTLLKILAGIYQPSEGSVHVRGKLVPFIELGVGFNPELTGRENVYLNGALLGFERKKIEEMYKDIVEFAELEKFMDQKLKNYSSGMQVRLAFSMAIRAEADILLIDEVLAVGDADFQRKCFSYFKKLKKNKKTVVFVSHDMSAVREYCDKAVLIEKSAIITVGTADHIATRYTKMFNTDASPSPEEVTKRWGDGHAKIDKVSISPSNLSIDSSKTFHIDINITAISELHDPVIGFIIKDGAGNHLIGTNTKIKKAKLDKISQGKKKTISWEIPNIFADGTFLVDVAISHSDGITQCDWWEDAARFRVFNSEQTPYAVSPSVKVSVS